MTEKPCSCETVTIHPFGSIMGIGVIDSDACAHLIERCRFLMHMLAASQHPVPHIHAHHFLGSNTRTLKIAITQSRGISRDWSKGLAAIEKGCHDVRCRFWAPRFHHKPHALQVHVEGATLDMLCTAFGAIACPIDLAELDVAGSDVGLNPQERRVKVPYAPGTKPAAQFHCRRGVGLKMHFQLDALILGDRSEPDRLSGTPTDAAKFGLPGA